MIIGSAVNSLLALNPFSSAPAQTEPAPELDPPQRTKAAETAAEALSHYDLHHISANELSELTAKLKAGNHADADQLQTLKQLRASLDEQGADPDEQVDLVDLLTERLSQQQAQLKQLQGDPTAIATEQAILATRKQLALIGHLGTVQSGAASSVDAVV